MEFREATYVAGKTKEAFGVDAMDGQNFKVLENSPTGEFSVEVFKDGYREDNFGVVFKISLIPFDYLGINRKLKSVIKKTNLDLEKQNMVLECVGEYPLRLTLTKYVFDYEEGKDYETIRKALLFICMPIAMSLATQNFP